MSHKTLIIGGGPAGLAAAFWRRQQEPDTDLVVLEASAHPGGWVRTERRDGYLCELGPQAVRPSPELDALVAALGIQEALRPASPSAKTRWVGRNGRLMAVPTKPLGMLTTRLLSWPAKLRVLKEKRIPALDRTANPRESVHDFVARRFGERTTPLVQAMVSGIFAGSADRLEVASAFGMLVDLEREHGSVLRGLGQRRKAAAGGPKKQTAALYSLQGGMGTLTDRLAEDLGDRLVCDAPVESLEQAGSQFTARLGDGSTHSADEVVLACPARASAQLLAESAPDLAAELRGIPFASLASVYLGFATSNLPAKMRGFGFLLEPRTDTPVLGAIYCSDLFPDHAPAGKQLVRVMLGGVQHPEAAALDDERLVEVATSALRQHTGLKAEVSFQHVQRAMQAIPQYEPGHGERLQRIDRLLEDLPGLSLRGNSYRGIALAAQLGQE